MKRIHKVVANTLLITALTYSGITSQGVYADVIEVSGLENIEAKTQLEKTMFLEDNKQLLQFLEGFSLSDLKVLDSSYITTDEAASIKNFVENNIIQGETSDYKKARLIQEWIATNVEYGYSGEIGLRPYDVFTLKRAVCGGYSNLYQAMLHLVGIPNALVIGNTPSGGHVWNVVYADGKWFYSDATWGTGYFDKGVIEFAKDHKPTGLQDQFLIDDNNLKIGYEDGIAVVGVVGEPSAIQIPSTYKEFPIERISYRFYRSATTVKQIHLSERIHSFDGSGNMPQLEAYTVSDANPYFSAEEGVLYSKDFKELKVYPEGKKDKKFTLMKEVSSFDSKGTFSNSYLEEIKVQEDNAQFSSYDGAIYNKDKSMLVTVPNGKKNLQILGTVTLDIASLSFKENLETIVLQEGITHIPQRCFIGDKNLRNLYIPKSVTEISLLAMADWSQVCIYGEKGSYAEQFASDHNISFRLEKEGFVEEDDNWYYYQDGKALTGWITYGTAILYADVDGTLLSQQWVKHENQWFYIKNDFTRATKEWVYDQNKWYYLDEDGVMLANTWEIIDGIWYYFDGSGAMASNRWIVTNSVWYYVEKSGAMKSNSWIKDGIHWYYVEKNGAMKSNSWIKDGVHWYYVAGSGAMEKNKWIKSANKWYYVKDTGIMAESQWLKINQIWYYFETSGVMATNTIRDGWRINQNGVATKL